MTIKKIQAHFTKVLTLAMLIPASLAFASGPSDPQKAAPGDFAILDTRQGTREFYTQLSDAERAIRGHNRNYGGEEVIVLEGIVDQQLNVQKDGVFVIIDSRQRTREYYADLTAAMNAIQGHNGNYGGQEVVKLEGRMTLDGSVDRVTVFSILDTERGTREFYASRAEALDAVRGHNRNYGGRQVVILEGQGRSAPTVAAQAPVQTIPAWTGGNYSYESRTVTRTTTTNGGFTIKKKAKSRRRVEF